MSRMPPILHAAMTLFTPGLRGTNEVPPPACRCLLFTASALLPMDKVNQ
ncbi:hypothetical protein KNP414_03590 [Paenibacillus mucilaginosus KNP414]|uniref:Uncharacterized protein n=1 Tax=Paenibacillus mucilaginosus (strain KNP414) TaxID=1036673 RepID=F8FDG4_PAEMK|nr:hypothetical protein KNP414_03590 [Paenibacillus mucilaginosus KNP414]